MFPVFPCTICGCFYSRIHQNRPIFRPVKVVSSSIVLSIRSDIFSVIEVVSSTIFLAITFPLTKMASLSIFLPIRFTAHFPWWKWRPLPLSYPLWWRHNGCDSVSNHQPRECLLRRLIRRTSKKTSKLRVTGLCAGNSPETGEFPAQMASNAENVSIWWRHHAIIRSLISLLNKFLNWQIFYTC